MSTDLEKLAEVYAIIQKDPELFIEMMWGLTVQEEHEEFIPGKNITWQQGKILRAVKAAVNGKASKKISVVSGHGIGKSTILSMLIIWFLFSFKNSKVPCTAPTQGQMYDVLWSEIKKWVVKLPDGIKEMYDCSNDYIRMKPAADTWFARARTGKKDNPEALAGLHADFMMLVVDEASGVPDVIFESSKSALTGADTLFIMISNGTRLEGYFYNSHHKFKEDFQCLSFNSEQSPIVDRSFIEEIIRENGRDSDEYNIRVGGKFPNAANADDTGYLPLLLESELRFADLGLFGRKVLGIDPSGEGKDTTEWIIRDNLTAKIIATEKQSTEKTIASKTLSLMTQYGIMAEDICCDNFGVGANVAQELAMQGHRIRAFNVGEPSDNPEFLNKRAEYYWRLREWIRRGGTLNNSMKWIEELTKIPYRRNIRNQIQIMPKDEMRKRGIRSPNAADALMLTFAILLQDKMADNFRGSVINVEFDPY